MASMSLPCSLYMSSLQRAGVAAFSAITTGPLNKCAIVEGFDTQPAVCGQVECLEVEFFELENEEDGGGAGRYARVSLYHKMWL